MSLPPGFLDEIRSRVTLSSVIGRKVVWDARKSNQAKGDWWAPCPFHQEKSASFHVDDRKGFYYCFGCHQKGDAISFLKDAENMSFMEAVEALAREAGLPMPARDPKAAAVTDQRARLADVMEAAVRHYRLMLATTAGAEARAYLKRRGMLEETQARFEIGFAPDARQGVLGALTAKGVAPDLLVEAGLCAAPEGGGAPYDRFRDRIIFPIRDARGRCIGLGGRAMHAEARAKYLNSPETPLFDKGRALYNHGPAREACGKGAALIVAEGYMDVIALVEAGFGGAVAPLGTAVTEEQLRMLWRISPEPIISLDGDTAGQRAALRLIDLALPIMEAGQSLRFATVTGGKDPDELIKVQGPGAMQAVLDAARPMIDLLWARETEGQVYDSPERRAALDKKLREVLKRISDPSLRTHYGEEIRRLRAQLFAPRRADGERIAPFRYTKGGRGAFAAPLSLARPESKASSLVTSGPDVEERRAEALILAICATHPALIARFEPELERLQCQSDEVDRTRLWLLAQANRSPCPGADDLFAEARGRLDPLLSQPHVMIAPPVLRRTEPDFAALCLAEEFAKISARRGARAEIAEAERDMAGLVDEGLTWRVSRAAAALHEAERTRLDEADGGEDRTALSRQLQDLIDRQVWVKRR